MAMRLRAVSFKEQRQSEIDLKPGDRMGDYEVLELLGAGGMGKVYKVRNVISNRIEAMKLALSPQEDEGEILDRFIREIRVHASLEHPNIAGLRTAQQAGEQILMVMEYVEGETFETLLQEGPLPMAEVVGYAVQVLEALEYAHARGIVHRDIKPANIMVTREGSVKLMDFGIAKSPLNGNITRAGRAVGSLSYMSPEQIQGAPDVDVRSDLYQIGLWLYECLTGQRPFGGDSDYAIMIARLLQVAVSTSTLNPAVPPEVSRVITKALEKNPADRYQSAAALKAALQRAGRGAATSAPLSSGHDAQRQLARLLWLNHVALGFTASMMLATTAAAIWMFFR
jgi:serine/threonine protein kinase